MAQTRPCVRVIFGDLDHRLRVLVLTNVTAFSTFVVGETFTLVPSISSTLYAL